jgi:hypothetical protein
MTAAPHPVPVGSPGRPQRRARLQHIRIANQDYALCGTRLSGRPGSGAHPCVVCLDLANRARFSGR